MSEKSPQNLDNSNEQIHSLEQESLEPEQTIEVKGAGLSKKEIEEIQRLEYQLKYENSKKSQGEKFNNTVTLYSTNRNKQPGALKRWVLGAFAGLLSLGASAKEAKNPADSTTEKRPTKIEKSVVDGIEVKEGLKIRELTSQERNDWNAFIDFVKEKGLEGSDKLNKGSDALAKSLFSEYKKLHPQTTMDYEIVASVQYEMQKLRQNTQDFAKRHNDPNADIIMNYISKVDGWFGSQTSKSKFPFMIENQFHNNNLVSSKNLGLVNSRFEPEKQAQKMKRIPKGAKVEQLADGLYYENSDGDLVKVLDK